MKKIYVVDWDTNYGLNFLIISADDEEEARKIAKEKGAKGASEVLISVQEIIPITISGVILYPGN